MPNESTTRRFDYVHVLLLTERFRPIKSLPENNRVIAQFEQTIDVVPQTEAFLDAIDYNSAAQSTDKPATEEKSPVISETLTIEQRHQQVVEAAFRNVLTAALKLVRERFGQASSIDTKSVVSSNYQREFVLHVAKDIKASNSPNKEGVSRYVLIHDVVKRSVPSISQINEAKTKIAYAITKRTSNVRLDYLNLTETSTPLDDLYVLTHAPQVVEMNLAHSNFLFFPAQFTSNFSQLRTLNLSSNLLYHVPAEVGTRLTSLEHLDLTDCKNLISLPLTLPNLRNSLQTMHLFGCINLSFPPHAACVKAQIATQEGMSTAGVLAILDYIADPLSFVDFSLLGAKKALQNQVHFNHDRIVLAVPSYRHAVMQSYIEYELSATYKSSHWTIWRRYSQFLTLVSELEACLPAHIFRALPTVPAKTWSFHEDDDATCKARRVAMNKFVNALTEFDSLANEEQQQKGWKQMRRLDCIASFFELPASCRT